MTHTKDAALKLALEALWTTANPKAEEAITAIKAALAQDEASSSRAAQRPWGKPWVSLTDENMETLILKHAPPLHPDYKDDSLQGLLQATNGFLKELNT